MADPSPFEDFEDADAGAFEDAGSNDDGAGADDFGYEADAADGDAADDAAAGGDGDDDDEDPFGAVTAEDGAAGAGGDDGAVGGGDDDDAFGLGGADDGADGAADDDEDPFGAAAAAAAPEHALEGTDGAEDLEETPLAVWKEERAKVLADRASAAEEARNEAAEKARKEIDDFYRQREETLAKNQAAHRTEEKDAKEEMKTLMANGTMWEKVAKQVDLKPPAGTKGADSAKNARMRKLLLQLKQDQK